MWGLPIPEQPALPERSCGQVEEKIVSVIHAVRSQHSPRSLAKASRRKDSIPSLPLKLIFS
jgi:hypothetical protein